MWSRQITFQNFLKNIFRKVLTERMIFDLIKTEMFVFVFFFFEVLSFGFNLYFGTPKPNIFGKYFFEFENLVWTRNTKTETFTHEFASCSSDSKRRVRVGSWRHRYGIIMAVAPVPAAHAWCRRRPSYSSGYGTAAPGPHCTGHSASAFAAPPARSVATRRRHSTVAPARTRTINTLTRTRVCARAAAATRTTVCVARPTSRPRACGAVPVSRPWFLDARVARRATNICPVHKTSLLYAVTTTATTTTTATGRRRCQYFYLLAFFRHAKSFCFENEIRRPKRTRVRFSVPVEEEKISISNDRNSTRKSRVLSVSSEKCSPGRRRHLIVVATKTSRARVRRCCNVVVPHRRRRPFPTRPSFVTAVAAHRFLPAPS